MVTWDTVELGQANYVLYLLAGRLASFFLHYVSSYFYIFITWKFCAPTPHLRDTRAHLPKIFFVVNVNCVFEYWVYYSIDGCYRICMIFLILYHI